MSESEVPIFKRPNSGKERVAEYRERNPECDKLSRERSKLSLLRKKAEDPIFHEELKKKERARKAKQRKNRALKLIEEEKNEGSSEINKPEK